MGARRPGASCPATLQVAESRRDERKDQSKPKRALVVDRSGNERADGNQRKDSGKNVSNLYRTSHLDLLFVWHIGERVHRPRSVSRALVTRAPASSAMPCNSGCPGIETMTPGSNACTRTLPSD